MNRWFSALVASAAAAAGIYYLSNLDRAPAVPAVSSLPGAVQRLAQRVLTPGPLRPPRAGREVPLTTAGVVQATNAARAAQGLGPLSLNAALTGAAERKAADILARQYFEHVSPSGEGPDALARREGYEFIVVGENLALGIFAGDAGVVEDWMNSPGHRANILNAEYSDIGVAAVRGEFERRSVWVAVQEFGRPRSSCPAVDPKLRDRAEEKSTELALLEPQLAQLRGELAPGNRDPADEAEYRKRVEHYNDLAKTYNAAVAEARRLTDEYNGQVKAFNACAGVTP